VISFDFSESFKSCVAPRNLEITLYNPGFVPFIITRNVAWRHKNVKFYSPCFSLFFAEDIRALGY